MPEIDRRNCPPSISDSERWRPKWASLCRITPILLDQFVARTACWNTGFMTLLKDKSVCAAKDFF
jgi:hypothetical protein